MRCMLVAEMLVGMMGTDLGGKLVWTTLTCALLRFHYVDLMQAFFLSDKITQGLFIH